MVNYLRSMSRNLPQPERPVLVLLAALGLVSVAGCRKDVAPPAYQTVVNFVDTIAIPPNSIADADGNIYSTTVIGNQRWMAENLRTGHYANGDPIPYLPDNTAWLSLTAGAWSNYASDAAYGDIYGKLYNWYTVVDPQSVCPSGWHVPTDADWMELEENLGVPVYDLDNAGSRGAAANAGGRLKADVLWISPNTGATDSSSFSAFPGGVRTNSGNFQDIGLYGYWWSASEFNSSQAWYRSLVNNDAGVVRYNGPKHIGASIRCVED